MKAVPNDRRSAASVRASLAICKNSAGPMLAARSTRAASGSSTMRLERRHGEAKRQPETGQDAWLAQAREGWTCAMVRRQFVGL